MESGRQGGNVMWECLCGCGNIVIVRSSRIRRKTIKSCGCLTPGIISKSNTKHGKRFSGEYNTWVSMVSGCRDKNNDKYHRYGGRGIKICDSWLEFKNFYKDMGSRPIGKQIDRKNNELGYFKENCRWVTSKENNRNRRDNRMITHNMESKCIAHWAEDIGMNKETLGGRLRAGWSIKRAIEQPIEYHAVRKHTPAAQ